MRAARCDSEAYDCRESQVDKRRLHWDNASELVSCLESTGNFSECIKVLGLQLNPLQVALAILESRLGPSASSRSCSLSSVVAVNVL